MKRTDLPFSFRQAVSKVIGKASADGSDVQMRLVGDDTVWTFGDAANFELHEDGFLIRNGEESIAVPYSSILYLRTA